MSEYAVSVHGLRKRYLAPGPYRGDRRRHIAAVDQLELRIRPGEVYALLGPNGAGKTTIVEILAGHRRRDAGTVEVLGADPATAPLAWRRLIGIVLQHTRDVAELTVAETVRHFAGFYPRPREPAEVIDQVGLAGLQRRRLRTLSVGQRRRVDVAIGIVGRPRLLFLDEPTTGFDPRARREFWDLIRELAAGHGTTILLTTHYLDEAEQLADRVGVLRAGRIVAEGAPAQIGGRGALATVGWREGTQPRTAQVADPAALICQLAARLGTVPDLTVHRPTLEETYLHLIGADPP